MTRRFKYIIKGDENNQCEGVGLYGIGANGGLSSTWQLKFYVHKCKLHDLELHDFWIYRAQLM
jgi:hypothetical protein